MSTVYNWVVGPFDTAPSQDGLTNVVKIVHWRYSAQDGEYVKDTYGSISLDPPNAENFTPFNELTKQKVVEWLETKLDVAKMQEDLVANIERLKNPPIVTLQVPWVDNV